MSWQTFEHIQSSSVPFLPIMNRTKAWSLITNNDSLIAVVILKEFRNLLRIEIQRRLCFPTQCTLHPVTVKLPIYGNSSLTNYSTLSLIPMKKLKLCHIVRKIPIPMKLLLQCWRAWGHITVGQRKKVTAVTFFRCPTVISELGCLGTKHLDMMAVCQNMIGLHWFR